MDHFPISDAGPDPAYSASPIDSAALEIDEAMRIAAMRGDLVLRVNPWHPNNSIMFKLLNLLMAGTVETPALANLLIESMLLGVRRG